MLTLTSKMLVGMIRASGGWCAVPSDVSYDCLVLVAIIPQVHIVCHSAHPIRRWLRVKCRPVYSMSSIFNSLSKKNEILLHIEVYISNYYLSIQFKTCSDGLTLVFRKAMIASAALRSQYQLRPVVSSLSQQLSCCISRPFHFRSRQSFDFWCLCL